MLNNAQTLKLRNVLDAIKAVQHALMVLLIHVILVKLLNLYQEEFMVNLVFVILLNRSVNLQIL